MLDESLFSKAGEFKAKIESLKQLLKKESDLHKHYKSETDRLNEVIRLLKKQAFGPKSERWESEEQYRLFNEAESEAKKPDPPEEEASEVKPHKRKRGKRQPLPGNLEREVVVIDLPEEEKVDEDGKPLKVIGKLVSEKLTYEPAKVTVTEYQRLRYGKDAGEPVKTAPPVPMIIPKGIVTPSLLAGIITAKYADGLPLYRQEEIFKRHDILVSRSSMGRWILRAGEACRPIWNILEERLMAKQYVACDETHTQVLKERGRKAQSKSWMWVRCNPSDLETIVLFNYDPRRSKDVARDLFEGFKGYLQVDGFASYDVLEKNDGLVRIGCNMHGRRKFHEALTLGAKQGKTLAEEALKFYQMLYAAEEEYKKELIDFDERHKRRQEEAVPIWDEFGGWAKEKQRLVPPKSKIGQAFTYFTNQYDELRGYLKAGFLEPDNGLVERQIKYFAMGRKAWLFSDSESGAEASELFYSLVVTAKANGVNPFKALKEIFTEIPKATSIEDFERLANLLLGPTTRL